MEKLTEIERSKDPYVVDEEETEKPISHMRIESSFKAVESSCKFYQKAGDRNFLNSLHGLHKAGK